MNERDMPPLPADVAAALAAERARPGVDATTRARLRARLHASLPGAPPELPAEPGSTSALTPGQPGSGVWQALRSLNPGITAAVGFAVGMTTGVAAHAWWSVQHGQPPAESSPARSAERTADRPQPVLPRGIVPSSPEVNSSSGDVRMEALPAPSVPSPPSLAAERALLDIARTALANGEASAALDALGRHGQKFPRGVYREEREALTIKALRALGRSEEAARRADAFETRYPKSLFRSIVRPLASSNP